MSILNTKNLQREQERTKNYLAMRNFRVHKRPNKLLTLIGFPQAFLTKMQCIRTCVCDEEPRFNELAAMAIIHHIEE